MTNPDSLYVYYISGTGNARLTSQWIVEVADKKGLKTVVQQIDRLRKTDLPLPEERPLTGFVYPTHGFNAAPLMLKFIAGFPRGDGREIFLANTRAGMKLYKLFTPGLSGLALIVPALILRLKGYRCVGFRPVDLPSNWISVHPGLKTKVIESIIDHWEPKVKKFAEDILAGKRIYRGLYSLPVDLVLIPVAAAYYLAGRFFLAKTFIANSNCNNCGICIEECPTESITMIRGRPYWKMTCESCMRCMNRCPQQAIETAHGMATGMILLASAAYGWLIKTVIEFTGLAPSAWWWKGFSDLLSFGLMVAVAYIVYLIMHYGMHFRAVRIVVRFTSLTAIPGWRRYSYLIRGRKKKNNDS
ncbi:MAG: EFR1 family ferrodoxin [Bacteroidales bacterium]|nr:EFR1 family ferrodoxin [Bacteroidales bacterium]